MSDKPGKIVKEALDYFAEVGPTGAGKVLAEAALAAAEVLDRLRVDNVTDEKLLREFRICLTTIAETRGAGRAGDSVASVQDDLAKRRGLREAR